jgi:hypothetical protein
MENKQLTPRELLEKAGIQREKKSGGLMLKLTDLDLTDPETKEAVKAARDFLESIGKTDEDAFNSFMGEVLHLQE